jgi:hypothetical protein
MLELMYTVIFMLSEKKNSGEHIVAGLGWYTRTYVLHSCPAHNFVIWSWIYNYSQDCHMWLSKGPSVTYDRESLKQSQRKLKFKYHLYSFVILCNYSENIAFTPPTAKHISLVSGNDCLLTYQWIGNDCLLTYEWISVQTVLLAHQSRRLRVSY